MGDAADQFADGAELAGLGDLLVEKMLFGRVLHEQAETRVIARVALERHQQEGQVAAGAWQQALLAQETGPDAAFLEETSDATGQFGLDRQFREAPVKTRPRGQAQQRFRLTVENEKMERSSLAFLEHAHGERDVIVECPQVALLPRQFRRL